MRVCVCVCVRVGDSVCVSGEDEAGRGEEDEAGRGCTVDAAGNEIDEDTEEDIQAWGRTANVEVYVQQIR